MANTTNFSVRMDSDIKKQCYLGLGTGRKIAREKQRP